MFNKCVVRKTRTYLIQSRILEIFKMSIKDLITENYCHLQRPRFLFLFKRKISKH